ncbi:ferrous iron transport protein A [Actinobaculum sp. 352]|nr:ferrous iron transport protein A [Actinobaculum sp. 313]RTE48630.1 ferrous iron transport protein A [Actinobaculum sp. 352]
MRASNDWFSEVCLVKLHDCPRHVKLRLVDVDLPAQNMLRMQELGIRPGTEAVVTQHAGFGGLILNVAGSRVAVDHRSARLIDAEVIG